MKFPFLRKTSIPQPLLSSTCIENTIRSCTFCLKNKTLDQPLLSTQLGLSKNHVDKKNLIMELLLAIFVMFSWPMVYLLSG